MYTVGCVPLLHLVAADAVLGAARTFPRLLQHLALNPSEEQALLRMLEERCGPDSSCAATLNARVCSGEAQQCSKEGTVNGLEMLIAAIQGSTVPGAPPSSSHAGAWIGLAFLETSLRQNHIRRISETLSLQEHGKVNRTVELDVSLNLLDEVQATAGLTYSTMRTRRAHSIPALEEKALMWVPIARVGRATTSPVEVRGADGLLVPRLTQSECGRLLAPGMYQLLRSILRADPRATQEGRPLHELLNGGPEARWLVQLAVKTLFEERSLPSQPTSLAKPAGDGRWGPLALQKNLACEVLSECADSLNDFYALLEVALNEQLVIIGLPSNKDEHHLQYVAPLRADPAPPVGRLSNMLRQTSPSWRGYRISYSTTIPASVRSYHLVVEAESALAINKLVIASDSDREAVEELTTDLLFQAGLLEQRSTQVLNPAAEKILELELETTARAVAHLRRRRQWQAEQAGGHLDRHRCAAFERLASVAVSGHAHPASNGEYRSSLLVNPEVTAHLLRRAAAELVEASLHLDVSHERDPVSNRAHAYWRQEGAQKQARGSQHLQASLRVSDAVGTGTATVGRFILAVMTVTYAVGWALFADPRFWRWQGDSDPAQLPGPLIGVLLLVPGYLYSRLDLPVRTSITARLRRLARVGAYCSIGSMVLLAGFVASNPDTEALRVAFWVVLATQSVFALVMLLRHALLGRGADPALAELATAAPAWLYTSTGNRDGGSSSRFDVRFVSGLTEPSQ